MLWLFSLFISIALILGEGSVVLAQDDAQGSAEAYQNFILDPIVVTGSRIVREDGFGQTSPVTSIGMEDIKSFGYTRLEDVLNCLPQFDANQTAFKSNGATGTASIDLRGLSPKRTLVLINGRRMQPGGTNTQFVDINQIPAAMVERVDVLTGGASAVYGSDAVAGVVNFIMREVDGVELSLGASGYQHHNDNKYIQSLMDEKGYNYPTGNSGIDGKAYDIDFAAGNQFADGRGHATIYATWRKNDELLQSKRDYSSCALDSAGTECGGSGNSPVPNFIIGPLVPDTADGKFDWDNYWEATLQEDSSLDDWVGNLYNYAPPNHFMRPDERWSAGGFADLVINESATVYIEVMHTNDHSCAQIAESGTFFDEEYYLPIDNALFPETFQNSLASKWPDQKWFGFLIGKRNTEGGPRVQYLDHDSLRIVGGVKGDITKNWSYDVSCLEGQTTSTSSYLNDFLADHIRTAINSEACAADESCLPYQVFTYQGVTPEQAAGLSGTANSVNKTSIEMVSASLEGNLGVGLPAGDILVAGGYEFRKETYEDIRDYVYEQGLLLGQGRKPSISGDFYVSEIFGEANIPILADAPAVRDLTMDLALRLSDHNITGPDTTYRVGLDYTPVDRLRIRTGYNRAVRSPNIEELFAPRYVTLWSGIDPCAGTNPIYSQEQCANTGVTANQYGNVPESPASEYNQLSGGNKDLEPEEADTYTFGVVVDPIENFRFSVDYWDIKIDNAIDRIGSESAEMIINICAETGQLCDLIHRGSGGDLWISQVPYVENTYQNIGEENFQGVDLAASYWLDALAGDWNINIIGTYMLVKETTPIASLPSSNYDCACKISTDCFPTPKWRHIASFIYDSQEFWSITGRWRYYSSVDYNEGTDQIADENLSAKNYFDLNAILKLGKHDIIIGVNNIFDVDPPLIGDTMSLTYGNANSVGLYDPLGRFFYTRLTLRF